VDLEEWALVILRLACFLEVSAGHIRVVIAIGGLYFMSVATRWQQFPQVYFRLYTLVRKQLFLLKCWGLPCRELLQWTSAYSCKAAALLPPPPHPHLEFDTLATRQSVGSEQDSHHHHQGLALRRCHAIMMASSPHCSPLMWAQVLWGSELGHGYSAGLRGTRAV
jgi:hypothetical protein